MITFILRREHGYCAGALCDGYHLPIPRCTVLAYEDLFRAKRLPPATYIFGDTERLSDLELVIAAEIASTIADASGFRVLNDPAKVRTRFGLLRALHEAGINQFDAYPADGFPKPKRFPVFVRSEAAHDKPLTGLLPDQAALDSALARLPVEGIPLRGLIVIEFCAEPFKGDVWRRYGTFRFGGEVSLDHVVSEKNWNVKYGAIGLVDEATYVEDHEHIVANAWSDELQQAFEIAGIDYGRADFGIVDGKPQIYEINTNPGIDGAYSHPSPTRNASIIFAQERFARLLRSIDTDGRGASVALDGPRMRHERWIAKRMRMKILSGWLSTTIGWPIRSGSTR